MYSLYILILVNTCDKPTITSGTVQPSDTTVDYQATYKVTCNTGYTISGTSMMTCAADGTFDQNPTCEGNLFNLKLTSYHHTNTESTYIH